MPITLPNSGLICPEAGDPQIQACEQIKALFAYVDTLPTEQEINVNPCVTLSSINWAVQGDPAFKNFKQTVSVPEGVNPFKSAMTIVSSTGEQVALCIEVDSFSTVCVFTNTPSSYELIFG